MLVQNKFGLWNGMDTASRFGSSGRYRFANSKAGAPSATDSGDVSLAFQKETSGQAYIVLCEATHRSKNGSSFLFLIIITDFYIQFSSVNQFQYSDIIP